MLIPPRAGGGSGSSLIAVGASVAPIGPIPNQEQSLEPILINTDDWYKLLLSLSAGLNSSFMLNVDATCSILCSAFPMIGHLFCEFRFLWGGTLVPFIDPVIKARHFYLTDYGNISIMDSITALVGPSVLSEPPPGWDGTVKLEWWARHNITDGDGAWAGCVGISLACSCIQMSA